MKSLNGKVIIVTGSAGLLGRSITKYLEENSAEVIGVDIYHGEEKSKTIVADTTNEQEINSLIENVVNEYGRIDGWVNNAYPRTEDWGAKIEDIKLESWRQNVDLQMNSYYMCCKAVLEQMKKQKSGCVVNMLSIYGIVGPDFSIYEGTNMTMPAAYSAIKGGLLNLTRYLASYYGPFGIRVNAISPGGILDKQPSSFIEKYESRVPLRRLGRPEDIAPGVAYLLSDEASYINGHNLVIDGGWTAI